MEYFIVLVRTLFFYILITIVYRFMGKREVGQLGIIDLIVSILIAELVSISINNINESIMLSVIPIILLVLLQVMLAYGSLKFPKLRKIFDGSPSLIIKEGKIIFKEMLKQRYNLDDLLSQLREQNIKSIKEVSYAVLETNGKLSVFTKERTNDYPLALILDGKIDKKVLKDIGKNETWLNNLLKKEYLRLDEIFYAFYTKKDLYIITKDELI